MTYITPDDWGLNHNIAPGDARGPQPPPEPFPQYAGDRDGMWSGNASKGLAPRPPFRGYFGRPPSAPAYDHRTHSPFAVPDGLWVQGVVPLRMLHSEGVIGPVLPTYRGVNGLGWIPTARGLAIVPVRQRFRSGLGEITATEALKKAESEMKQAAIESAAAQTSLTIALNFIPVVGTAVSIVMSVVMAIGTSVYRRKAEEVMAGLKRDLDRLAASYQVRLEAVKLDVFNQEKAAGIQLALSGATLEGGLGSWAGDAWRSTWKKVVSPAHHVNILVQAIQKPVQDGLRTIQKITPDSVDRVLQKPIDQMNRDQAELNRADAYTNEKLATLSGEQQWIIAQERAAQAYAAASKDMDAQFQTACVNMQSTQYRQALQVAIAKRIRSDPNMAALISNIGGAQAQSLVARLTGQVTNTYAAPGQPGAGIPIPQQASTSEKVAIGAMPLIGAVVAFLALGGRG